jgi:hypothetical protein
MTDPQHNPENDLDRDTAKDGSPQVDSGTLAEEPDKVPAPDGWVHSDDGGITAVDVPWKGYTG